ncbi:rab1 small GTP-binding protein, partial [Trypanosoma cruzi]
KTGCAAARCSNRGGVQFGSTRDLAVGEARQTVRTSPEYCSISGEVHHNADPGVAAGRIDVKGETAEGQEPWLKAEERFLHDFHPQSATITRRATRTCLATLQDEHAIPLKRVNVPVLNTKVDQWPVEPGYLGEAHASLGTRRAVPFPSVFLR